MTLRPIDNYYTEHEEVNNSILQYLRQYILGLDNDIAEGWKYGMPFFYYKKKRLCYFWVDKKTNYPYIGIVDGALVNHPDLIQGNRTKMKILSIDPTIDIPIKTINEILMTLIEQYKTSL